MSKKTVSDSGGGTFEPHPEGQFAVRCIDVVELGWVVGKFGPKYKYRFVFYAGETVEREVDGKKTDVPQFVMAYFTATLSEKGNLRPFLESWRGKPFTKTELDSFDLEMLYNAPGFIQVTHNSYNDRVYANITTIMRIPDGMHPPDAPADYIRVEDRPEWEGPAPHPEMSSHEDRGEQAQASMTEPDDDLPF